jgi:hypothetical protein
MVQKYLNTAMNLNDHILVYDRLYLSQNDG